MLCISLLPLEIVNIVAEEPDPQANDCDHLKNLFLKHFKMSADKFKQKLVSHIKESSISWRDFKL